MGPREFEPEALVEILVRHAVDFVLIGGLAAQAHGSPFATQDVDITPDSTRANLERLSAALLEMDARVRAEGVEGGLPFAHDATSLAAAGVWNLTTPYGDLDISMVPSGTDGFGDLVTEAAVTQVFGHPVRIAALADVIRSKQAANRLKDQRVLPVLREILATRHDRENG